MSIIRLLAICFVTVLSNVFQRRLDSEAANMNMNKRYVLQLMELGESHETTIGKISKVMA